MAIEYKLSYTASEINRKLGQIDNLATKNEIPTNISDLINDSGFISEYTETDPTVPAWAKASTKPSYTASEVGALPEDTQIPSNLSDLTEDSEHRTVTDEEKEVWSAKSDFSGSYNDLTDKPTIPSIDATLTQSETAADAKVTGDEIARLSGSIDEVASNIIQSDWNQSDETALDYIKNKPDEYDAFTIAVEMGLVSPTVSNDGFIFIDENDAVYSI